MTEHLTLRLKMPARRVRTCLFALRLLPVLPKATRDSAAEWLAPRMAKWIVRGMKVSK